ncbi:MAG: hypothetical protein KBT30_00410, partial [Clostridiales bacterium]|nr:hypothetical protein [Candidatus Apopatousia equi]
LKFNKVALKYIVKIAISVLLICYLFFAPLTIFKSLSANQSNINHEIEVEYMGILELWNIDTFEGGSVSRTNFLEKQAIKFEKEHTGTFIMISNMSLEQAKLNLENGKTPDLVSFGIGVGEDLIQSLKPFSNNFDVRSDLLSGGKYKNSQLAIPYILGGYTLVSDTDYQKQNNFTITNCLGFGGASQNNTVVSLAVNDITFNNYFDKSKEMDSFTAYDRFLSKKFDTLLGTQRDLYRVKNRIEKNTMTQKNYVMLPNFSDLVQYVGICSTDAVRYEICNMFVKKLLSVETQSTLNGINMFSTLNLSLYEGDEFEIMEKALSKNLKTISVFSSEQDLLKIKSLAFDYCTGNNEAKAELEKFLV